MTERPILFNCDMVRAILRGQKTQTRRPVMPQPVIHPDAPKPFGEWTHKGQKIQWGPGAFPTLHFARHCPFGQPGDRLLVRAMSNLAAPDADNIMLEITNVKVAQVQDITGPEAIAEGAHEFHKIGDDPTHPTWTMGSGIWRYDSPREAFAAAWDSLYAKRGLGWDANPWVWIITFKRIYGK